MTGEFTRTVTFCPAWDRRQPDPKKNYGVHGVEIRFLLLGPKGATQFLLYTNWQLPHVRVETDARTLAQASVQRLDQTALNCFFHPLPADLGYHAYAPQCEGQERMESCDALPDLPEGQGCYYDGSSLRANDVYQRLLREGDAGVWTALEEEYRLRFMPAVEAEEVTR